MNVRVVVCWSHASCRQRAALLAHTGLIAELQSDTLASITLRAADQPVLQAATLATLRALLYYAAR